MSDSENLFFQDGCVDWDDFVTDVYDLKLTLFLDDVSPVFHFSNKPILVIVHD